MRNVVVVIAAALGVVAWGALACADDTAPPNEIARAEHFLVKFEAHVTRAGGKPFPLAHDDDEAARRVRSLKERFPKDPTVESMFQRTRAALMASKGGFIQITPAMVAYRETERKLVGIMAERSTAAWQDFRQKLAAAGNLIEKALPAADPKETDIDAMIGKVVVLDEFRYPDNEFMEVGGQYAFVGSQSQGFYYVTLSSRAWLGVYEALKRYRRNVTMDVPAPWTLVGRITGVNLLIPQAGKEKTLAPSFGWLVEPMGLWAEGKVFTVVDAKRDAGGTFAGEDELESIKEGSYTYKEVPADVEPRQLVTIFATAIKEKNWQLYLACIDPARQKTPKAIQRLRYFYEDNLERYRRFYVHVDPYELESINVISGFRFEPESDEDFFLDEEQRKKLKEHSAELVEQATVMIRTYDERGTQSAFPKKVLLRRYEGGRWHVASGYPL